MDLKCEKCGSRNVVPEAQTFSRGSEYRGSVSVVVPRSPDALLFKGEKTADICARVCGDCGHLELFVRGAWALYRAYQESITRTS